MALYGRFRHKIFTQRYLQNKLSCIVFLISTLKEASHEAGWQPLVPSKVVAEIRQNVSLLLPEVHCFLVLCMRLEEEHVDNGQLVRVSVSLELLSHPCPQGRNGQRDIVHRLDLRRSSDPFAVGRKDSTLRIRPTGRLRRLLGELGRRNGHGG